METTYAIARTVTKPEASTTWLVSYQGVFYLTRIFQVLSELPGVYQKAIHWLIAFFTYIAREPQDDNQITENK